MQINLEHEIIHILLDFLKLNGTFILCVHDLNIENGILQKKRNSHFFLVMDWCPLRDLPQSSRNGKAINAEVDFLELAKNIIERDADDE